MRKRFEFKDKKSHKFWEIELTSDSYTTYYGRIGTTPRSDTKGFDTNEKAKEEYKKIIAKKVKKGYKELSTDTNTLVSNSNSEVRSKEQEISKSSSIKKLSGKEGDLLKILEELVKKLQETSSTLEKKEILSNYPQCKELLWWIYNPFKQFFVTSTNLKKGKKELVAEEAHKSFIELLTDLSERNITGHAAIEACNAYIRDHSKFAELLYNAFDKDLKTRCNIKLINQVWPKHIPTFEVALANKYKDYSHKINFESNRWFMSRKLDGIRVITTFDEDGDIGFYSRTGKPFTTLKKIEEELKKLKLTNVVLDGEMCIVEENGNEDFTKIVSQIKRKDYTIEHPKYMIFDYLDAEEFQEGEGKVLFSERLVNLKRNVPESAMISHVKQVDISSIKDVEDEMIQVEKSGWEGLMLRLDAGYKGKRSNDILKVKKFHDAEYKVLDIEIGPFRIIEDGKEKTIDTMTNVIIEHKGTRVSVGSGFSLDERKRFKEDPDQIIGKIITVQYFEESRNQNDDSISLRFPIKKTIYEGDRDI
jgi:DNA ligase-1